MVLFSAILQVIVAQVANLAKVRPNLVVMLSFFWLDGPATAEVDVVAHAMSIVERHMGVNRVTFRVALNAAGWDEAMARHDDIGDAQIDRIRADPPARQHAD